MVDPEKVLYLTREEVAEAVGSIDPVAAVRQALMLHATGEVVLPDEAYLGWTTPDGYPARSLNMPALLGGALQVAGTKIINSSLGNRIRSDLPRADGLLMLFDLVTARPYCVMDASLISALRTASVTALAAEEFGAAPIEVAALLGCGELASAHLRLLLERLPSLQEVALYDIDQTRADAFVERHSGLIAKYDAAILLVQHPREAVGNADIIVPVTTVTEGYIEFGWLRPGALVVNVSLDDLLPEVYLRADLVLVDDWRLVSTDGRRLLGRLHRQGVIYGPGDEVPASRRGHARRVEAELGQALTGAAGRRTEKDVIVVNPFGLAIEDVAVAARVYAVASERGLGTELDR